ncbi:MAG: hypothetical protein FJZ38_18000 [Candidatus Rokubacteria bacterium]|nr:hypothetical protein [Candidatus Rokubacteria bacterium]
MKKSEVYSWRVAPATKAALEAEARRARSSVATLLDQIAHDWLRSRQGGEDGDAAEQARRHAALAKVIGLIDGRDPHRAERGRVVIRERFKRRRGR